MLTKQYIYWAEGLDLDVTRSDDEIGSVTLTLTVSDNEVIQLHCGQFYDDAVALKNTLEAAARQAVELVAEWQDRPDESDGFITYDRDGWHVSLDGSHVGAFPTEEIATYELARAMADAGYFPNAWILRHQFEDLLDVSEYLTSDGGLRPLDGVEYVEDAEVQVDGWRAHVIRDYGHLGLVYVLAGDDTEHFAEHRPTTHP